MAFWTKKPGSDGSEKENAPLSKPSPDIFTPQSKQDIRNLFERKTETVVDVDSVLEKFGKVRSALGSGTVIQGKLTFDTPVRIDGKLSGEIFSSAALVVGPSGLVDATVEVSQLVVLGSVKGTVTATDRVEVYAGGTLEGAVNTPVLIIEKGCAFSGDCKMPQREQKSVTAPVQPSMPVQPKKEEPGKPHVEGRAKEDRAKEGPAGKTPEGNQNRK